MDKNVEGMKKHLEQLSKKAEKLDAEDPSCGKMVKFNGTDLIELIPGEMEEIMFR